MQPGQTQPNIPTPSSPSQAPAPDPAAIQANQQQPVDTGVNPGLGTPPTVQPIQTIQAPSQANLQQETESLTTPGVTQTLNESGPTQSQQISSEPVNQPIQQAVTGLNNQPQLTQPAQQIPTLQPQPSRPDASQKPKLTKEQQAKQATAQNSLLISEIRENMVIMNDGSFRAVVACDSINYDLMSNEEREGIEYSYQNFLNNLFFPVQITIQSRKIDLKPYTEKLEKIRSTQENMLLGVLMDEYLDFIFDISQQANIMRKDFFVVVPYSLTGDVDSAVNSFKNLSENVITSVQKPTTIKISAKDYTKAKDEMKNRVSTVVNGLMNMGIRAGQLPTKALSELYYNFYNPDTAIDESVNDFQNYTGLFTTKGPGEAPLPGMENM